MVTRFLFLCLIVILFSACKEESEPKTPHVPAKKPIETWIGDQGDSIDIPPYIHDLDSAWMSADLLHKSFAPDFVYYPIGSPPRQFYDLLNKSEPVLFFSFSETSLHFQQKKREIITMVEMLSGIQVLPIYVLEQYPSTGPTPYLDEPLIIPDSMNTFPRVEQSLTLDSRKMRMKLVGRKYNMPFEPVADAADNGFWNRYGKMPTSAFLVCPHGKFNAIHRYFDPETMKESIRVLLELGCDHP